MTFIEETIQQNISLWEECFHHPFVKAIRQQTMSKEMFLFYLKEDTKYLREYARVFGMGIYKSTSIDEICLFFDLLRFVETNESAARVKLLKEAGFDYRTIEQETKQKECEAYTSFLHKTACEQSTLAILFATLPCMLSYAYIGERMIKENPKLMEDNIYKEWILEYSCEEYFQKCKEWMKIADQMCEGLNKESKQQLQSLFHTASIHELAFWDMSYQRKERNLYV